MDDAAVVEDPGHVGEIDQHVAIIDIDAVGTEPGTTADNDLFVLRKLYEQRPDLIASSTRSNDILLID